MKRQTGFEGLYVGPTLPVSIQGSGLQCKPARDDMVKLVQVCVDAFAFALALLLSGILLMLLDSFFGTSWVQEALTNGLFETQRLTALAVVSLTAIAWFWGVLHHYTVRRPYSDEVREVIVVVFAAFLADAALSFMLDHGTSRPALVAFWLGLLTFLLAARFVGKSLLLKSGLLEQPCVFVGQGAELREALSAFDSEPLMGFKPVALIYPISLTTLDDGLWQDIHELGLERQVPVFPLTDSISDSLTSIGAKVVFVMGGHDRSCEQQLHALRQDLALKREDVYLIPPMVGLPLHGMQTFNFFSHEVLLLRATNKLKNRSARLLKRLFDVTASSAGLLVLSPLFLYVAWRIKRESPGTAFFKQKRIGLDGVEFNIYKFRSMVLNADQALEDWKLSHPDLWREYVRNNFKLASDPRVTPIGRLIRRTSIDELPQLINVFKGDMSLVGPRPLLARELDAYGSSIDVYTNVRPGISGLWQISGRSSTTFDARIALDRWYVRNWSFWNDLVILIRTVKVVLRSDGAH